MLDSRDARQYRYLYPEDKEVCRTFIPSNDDYETFQREWLLMGGEKLITQLTRTLITTKEEPLGLLVWPLLRRK